MVVGSVCIEKFPDQSSSANSRCTNQHDRSNDIGIWLEPHYIFVSWHFVSHPERLVWRQTMIEDLLLLSTGEK